MCRVAPRRSLSRSATRQSCCPHQVHFAAYKAYTLFRPPGGFVFAPGGPVVRSLAGLRGLSRRLPRGAGVQYLGQLLRRLVEGSSESFDACSMDVWVGYCDTRWGGFRATLLDRSGLRLFTGRREPRSPCR